MMTDWHQKSMSPLALNGILTPDPVLILRGWVDRDCVNSLIALAKEDGPQWWDGSGSNAQGT